MGLFSTKTSGKSWTNMEDWAEPMYKATRDSNMDIAAADPTDWVAPQSQLQTKAYGDVQSLGGWKPMLGQASTIAGGVAGQGPSSAALTSSGYRSILDNGGVDKYLDPMRNSYIDSLLSDYDVNTGQQRAQMQAAAAKNHAFGGSRSAIAQGQFEGDAGRGRGALEADALRQAYTQAAQLAMGEADRFQGVDQFNAGAANQNAQFNASLEEQAYQRDLQAAGLMGDLGDSYAGNERGDVALTGQMGDSQRAIASEYANAVPMKAQLLSSLLASFPQDAALQRKTTQKQSGGVGGQVLGAALQAAPMLFSDRRLKTDIKRVGTHGKLPLYSFRYIYDDRPRTGVMADEVAIHNPEALGPEVNGFATVDYSKLGLSHLVEG